MAKKQEGDINTYFSVGVLNLNRIEGMYLYRNKNVLYLGGYKDKKEDRKRPLLFDLCFKRDV